MRVYECPSEGPTLRTERDAVDLIAEASGAEWIAIPVARLGEGFFHLRTGAAGAILQKFLTYHRCVAIVGDIAAHVEASTALRDFVYECNHGEHVWFVGTMDELRERLNRAGLLG